MTEAEIRGALLEHFYGMRNANGGWVPTDEIILSPCPVSRPAIANACQHLAEAGYVRWEPYELSMKHHTIGRARITGAGVDVVTGARGPSIDIYLPSTEEQAKAAHPPPLAQAAEILDSSNVELVTLKPTLWGMSIDLKELIRRLQRWRKGRK